MYEDNMIMRFAMNIVQHYNHKKYWKMRAFVVAQPENSSCYHWCW